MEFTIDNLDRKCPDIEWDVLKKFKIDSNLGEIIKEIDITLERQKIELVCNGCKYFDKCYFPILVIDYSNPINCESIPEMIKALNEIKEIYDNIKKVK